MLNTSNESCTKRRTKAKRKKFRSPCCQPNLWFQQRQNSIHPKVGILVSLQYSTLQAEGQQFNISGPHLFSCINLTKSVFLVRAFCFSTFPATSFRLKDLLNSELWATFASRSRSLWTSISPGNETSVIILIRFLNLFGLIRRQFPFEDKFEGDSHYLKEYCSWRHTPNNIYTGISMFFCTMPSCVGFYCACSAVITRTNPS